MLDLKKYQKMSKDLTSGIDDVKKELAEKEIEGTSGGGAVKVVVNGNQEILRVEVSAEAVDPDDIEMLQDLFMAAANQALDASRELQSESLSHLTGGMNLPNMPFL